jgi:hypothetical protein
VDNNCLHTIDERLTGFEPISLASMDQVKLMDRVDSKFVLSFNDLLPVIENISQHYYILTINNKRIFSYRTDYYDTPDLEMFSDHHNGKLNRYKIRQREYIESDIRFLEVKFKSNKGRVIKDRIENKTKDNFDFADFILKHTPYNPHNLKVSLVNRFNRFTVVDKNMQERVTVDLNLCFSDHTHIMGLNGLVIIEIKQNKNSREGSIYRALKEKGVRPDSFSKYCLGIALLNGHNKFNNFKRTINLINKLSRVESNMIA